MQNKQNDSIVTSYKNPFDDYNANVLAPDLILQYWCTPFRIGALKDYDEARFFSEKTPVVIQGSRGSGKTTILKYFSFPVQTERAKQSLQTIEQQLSADGGVGFYLRCDDSFLNMFKTVFAYTMKESWNNCFKHYLELFFSKNILSMVQTLGFAERSEEEKFLSCLSLSNFDSAFSFASVNDLAIYIESEIRYINKYKNEALFTNQPFMPKHIWGFYELSKSLISAIRSSYKSLSNINFLLLIDEFENLPLELQKMFNNLIKFCDEGMSLRIGRRSENEVTTATVNDIEYLREGNDFRLVVLDYPGDEIQELKPYLAGIAEKRLLAFEGISVPHDIIKMLGDKENLDEECQRITSGRNRHLYDILRTNQVIKADDELCTDIIDTISRNDNILATSLCALWVARSAEENLREYAIEAADAMSAFLEKRDHVKKDKFRSDYENKYRYALTCLICSLYKKDKAYYGFNTICYLSEGNARTFINLVKAIISDALFYERKSFLGSGTVSIGAQSRAVKAFSLAEFNSVCSIIQGGKEIRNLILKIGEVLSEYHKDKFVRYPETTQFVYHYEELSEVGKEVIRIAEGWALIKKRKEKQRLSAGVSQEGYLCALKRVFSPIFNISYRIRGGVNVIFTSEDIDNMICGVQISKLTSGKNSRKTRRSIHELPDESNEDPAIEQLSMFDGGNA